MTDLRDLIELIADEKPRDIRQMLYRIVYLWVARVEIRVEAKTKTVWRELSSLSPPRKVARR